MTAKPPRMKIIPQRYVPPFENGDRMDQPTFHALYETTPPGFKAELVGGVVYMASPVSVNHGRPHRVLTSWIDAYAQHTEGTEWFSDLTIILADSNEPQPDLTLILLPEFGGFTQENDRGFLVGPPELVIEVAVSTAAIDLNAKRHDYYLYGVQEYLVVEVKTQTVHWFKRGKSAFQVLKPAADGSIRSKQFPGLWLNPDAVFERSPKALLETLHLGIASPEHAKFIAKLNKKINKPRKTS